MIAVDMIGAGDTYLANSLGIARPSMKDDVMDVGAPRGMTYRKESGMSDHEAFEKAGFPSVWIEDREPSTYHQPTDVAVSVGRSISVPSHR